MNCSKCGAALAEGTRFCGQCGWMVGAPERSKGSSFCLKFFLFGCLFLILSIIVLFAAGGYIANRWFGEFIASENSSFGRRIEDLQESHAFTPPKDGTLTDSQLERFLRVSEDCAKVLNSEEWSRELKQLEKSSNPYVDGFRFWQKFGNTYRNALLDALERQEMSLVEYQYVHKTALKSWGAMLKRQGETATATEMPAELESLIHQWTDVPEANLQVMERRKEDVEKFLPAAPFAKMLFPLLVDPDKDSIF